MFAGEKSRYDQARDAWEAIKLKTYSDVHWLRTNLNVMELLPIDFQSVSSLSYINQQ
jgi:hypothetical protein